ncbi:MAG: molybdopterin-dependent oxidoreductase [Anaerolineales bacterium]|jgi:DMSO/TMAO reductase YedYZ molybdopterin-dependent catalytic subunit
MKRILLLSLVFSLVLVGCNQTNTSANGDVLKVTDGTKEKIYTISDLEKLEASQATFRDVTYTGVRLSTLLQNAGVDFNSIKAVKAIAVDGFSANYDQALFNKEDTMVAYARADGPLTEDELPFRMVLPGEEGKMNPRQLVEIQVIK